MYKVYLKELSGKLPETAYNELKHGYSCFLLWSDGYGCSHGEVDRVLATSARLRHGIIRCLASICQTLANSKPISFQGGGGGTLQPTAY